MRVPATLRQTFLHLSPGARQWMTAVGLVGGLISIVWAAITLTESAKPATPTRAAPGAEANKVKNLNVLPPGASVTPVDKWIGDAGRKVAAFEHEQELQFQRNAKTAQFEMDTLKRLAELEEQLRQARAALPATPGHTTASAEQSSANGTIPVQGPAGPEAFPPQTALTGARGLPPPPPPPRSGARGGALPVGAPDFSGVPGSLPEGSAPTIVRVSLTGGSTLPQTPGAEPPKDGSASKPADKPDTLDTYLPVSFTRAILLGGLDAPTGGQSQSNPHPVLLRLSDNAMLPNQFRADVRECFVIGAGYGDISSERAYIRTENLSCIRNDGRTLEVKIQGGVFGEDGKYGMRGRLVTKQGQMLANALLAGVVSGIGQGLALRDSTVTTSTFGTVGTTTGSQALQNGMGQGVGRALDRLAQYYIGLAEKVFPVIEIDAGREVDIVLTKGTKIDFDLTPKAQPAAGTLRETDGELVYVGDSADAKEHDDDR